MTYYTVYKTTNTLNGKFYIGVHQTDDLDDGYIGSGTLLKRAVEKYGLKVFTKEYLAICESPEEMFALEGELVTPDLIVDAQCYNLKEGGYGGWLAHNTSAEFKWARAKGALARNRIPIKEEWRAKLSEAQRSRYESGANPNWKCDWTGRSHREETKRKIGNANRRMVGEKNSQFGTVWVYNENERRSIKIKENDIGELLDAGWKRGRKMKFP